MKKKRRLMMLIGFFVILLGLVALNYPYVSGRLNDIFAYKEIQGFAVQVEEMDTSEIDALLEKADAYNKALAGAGNIEEFKDFELIQNGAVLGSLEIPQISVNMAVRYSTSNDVLNRGLGLVEDTSLPVGGPSTHAVISGHSGMASMKALTDLSSIQVNDVFFVHSFGRDMAYRVDQILVVLPWENEALAIEPGEDYCTLLTCTPYGVNSHRLLVRGKRIADYDFSKPIEEVVVVEERLSTVEIVRRVFFYVSIAILVVMIVALIVEFTKKPKKKTDQKGKSGINAETQTNDERMNTGGITDEQKNISD